MRDRRESLGHGESLAALCHPYLRKIHPACRVVGMFDNVELSDIYSPQTVVKSRFSRLEPDESGLSIHRPMVEAVKVKKSDK
jgi:hypothetical protein